jgi:hypothetical protein
LFDDREQILVISQSWLEQSGYSKEELRRIEDWTIRAYGLHSDEVLGESARSLSLQQSRKRGLPNCRSARKMAANASGALFSLRCRSNAVDNVCLFALLKM